MADWKRRFGLPSRIVMAVGSNDIFDPPAFAAQVERAMRVAGPSRTVYWVNVHVSRSRQPAEVRAADESNSAWINQQLEQAAVRHPNLRIVRWAEYLATEPGGPAKYLRDGVHTSEPAGQTARNDLILKRCWTTESCPGTRSQRAEKAIDADGTTLPHSVNSRSVSVRCRVEQARTWPPSTWMSRTRPLST